MKKPHSLHVAELQSYQQPQIQQNKKLMTFFREAMKQKLHFKKILSLAVLLSFLWNLLFRALATTENFSCG